MSTKKMAVLIATILTLSLFYASSALAADTYTVIRNFNGNNGGGIPIGGLWMDQAGNLYGSNTSGGANGWGAIFKLTPDSQGGWNYTDLFNCTGFDCGLSMGSLVMDKAGNLYGATLFGNVFEVTTESPGSQTVTLLHAFTGGADGAAPSSVVLDAAGNLYGLNATGGSNNLGYVFELSPVDGGWSLTHLHDFTGSDGAATTGNAADQVPGVILDASGNIYGVTGAGGSSTKCSGGCGVVFELTNEAGTWQETVLHNFVGSDGSNPNAALMMDASGNLYGTATAGGTDGFGVVFKTSKVSGKWSTSVIHTFTGTHLDGEYPNSVLVMDAGGSLYGATFAGGGDHASCQVLNDFGCGMVFKLSPSGTSWKETILKAFSGRKDGAFPGAVVVDAAGIIYGTAQAGGRLFNGVAFKITPAAPSVTR